MTSKKYISQFENILEGISDTSEGIFHCFFPLSMEEIGSKFELQPIGE